MQQTTPTADPRADLASAPPNRRAVRERDGGRVFIVIDVTDATHAAVAQAVEAEHFAHLLETTGGNRKAAARKAGLGYRTFLERLGRLPLRFSVSVE